MKIQLIRHATLVIELDDGRNLLTRCASFSEWLSESGDLLYPGGVSSIKKKTRRSPFDGS